MSRRLVLLHGFTGSPESWTAVRRILREPGSQAREHPTPTSRTSARGRDPAYAPALIGHDGTAGPPEIGSFHDEVDRLAMAIDHRGLAGAHLAGYSMGGRLALGLLVRHPTLFRSATLIGTSPGLSDPADRAARAARDEEWARLLDEEGLNTFVAAWEALPLFGTQADLPRDVVDRQRRIRESHDPRGLARSLRVAGLARMPDYRPFLDAIHVPVRLVVGARDVKFRTLAEAMAERLTTMPLTVVPDAGHNVVLEKPAEVAALLREDITA